MFQWVSEKPTMDCRVTSRFDRTSYSSPHRLKRERVAILTRNPEKRVESVESRAKTDEIDASFSA